MNSKQKAQKLKRHAEQMAAKKSLRQLLGTDGGNRALQSIIQDAGKKEIEKVHNDAIVHATQCLTAAFLISISDEFDFGQKRLERLLKRVEGNFDSVLKGYLSVQDIKDWCDSKGLSYDLIFKFKDGTEEH